MILADSCWFLSSLIQSCSLCLSLSALLVWLLFFFCRLWSSAAIGRNFQCSARHASGLQSVHLLAASDRKSQTISCRKVLGFSRVAFDTWPWKCAYWRHLNSAGQLWLLLGKELMAWDVLRGIWAFLGWAPDKNCQNAMGRISARKTEIENSQFRCDGIWMLLVLGLLTSKKIEIPISWLISEVCNTGFGQFWKN